MSFASTLGAVVWGIGAHLVVVEAHVGPGLPEFRLIGLPDASVRESRDRVRAALRQAGVALPSGRLTVNLAPARLRKAGSALDLAIACAVLAATGRLPAAAVSRWLFLGELSLDARVQPTPGVLAMLAAALRHGRRQVVLPRDQWPLACRLEGLHAWPVATLAEVIRGFSAAGSGGVSPARLAPCPPVPRMQDAVGYSFGSLAPLEDLRDVRGQAMARRAIEVAAAGGHHLMMVGPPGSGKTMLGRRLVSVLPPLTRSEWLEVLQTYSAAGQLPAEEGARPEAWVWHPGLMPPMRAPHHSCTLAGLVGGGARLAPGELTLAHRGVLFIDEFGELQPEVVEALREPMETGYVTLVRGGSGLRSGGEWDSGRLPAEAIVVAASNPCPCGYRDEPPPAPACRCRPGSLERYRRRLHGPVADRFDLWVRLHRVGVRELLNAPPGDTSAQVRQRVMAARARQQHRYRDELPAGPGGPGGSRVVLNGRLTPAQVRRYCPLAPEVEAHLQQFARRLGITARRVDRIVQVARTLADLEGRKAIGGEHLEEAFQYQPRYVSMPANGVAGGQRRAGHAGRRETSGV